MYTDLYAGCAMVGTESGENSGKFSSVKISSSCAHNTPMQCSCMQGNCSLQLGYVFSLAQDNNNDIYYLTSTGVYRVARPSRCSYFCSLEKVVSLQHNKPHSSSSSSLLLDENFGFLLLLVFLTIH